MPSISEQVQTCLCSFGVGFTLQRDAGSLSERYIVLQSIDFALQGWQVDIWSFREVHEAVVGVWCAFVAPRLH